MTTSYEQDSFGREKKCITYLSNKKSRKLGFSFKSFEY